MAKKENPIHFVAFSDEYHLGMDELLAQVRDEVRINKGKPLVIVFPEAVLGHNAIKREESKSFLRQMNRILASHGDAFVFLSIFEHTGANKTKSLSNSGYVVTPREEKKWLVYPKVYHSQVDMGEEAKGKFFRLSSFDEEAFSLAQAGGPNAFRHWAKRKEKLRSFPRIKVGGKVIELRVCADLIEKLTSKNAFKHQRKANFLVVPAYNLQLENNIRARGRVANPNSKHFIISADRHSGLVVYPNKKHLAEGKLPLLRGSNGNERFSIGKRRTFRGKGFSITRRT